MKPTIKELQKEIEAKGQLIIDKNSEIIDKDEEITKIQDESRRFQDRCSTLERERDSLISKSDMITNIINGKSRPLSKIEVLKDLFNPRGLHPTMSHYDRYHG